MRQFIEKQMQFGQINISEIKIELDSRDEIPRVLLGLKHIYCDKQIRDEVFNIMREMIPQHIDWKNGRMGMDLWSILVLGTVMLSCNTNYDHLQQLANHHDTIREMLGHSSFVLKEKYVYEYRTIANNIKLFTPYILDRINQVVVNAGHHFLGLQNPELRIRTDSFVVKTDVNFPTDIRLLYDSTRKSIELIAKICSILGWSNWRQSQYNIRVLKKAYNKIIKTKRSRVKERDEKIQNAYQDYFNIVNSYIFKIHQTLNNIPEDFPLKRVLSDLIQDISIYLDYADHQMDLSFRRNINNETIPHKEKIHSIFEPHTRWISKGKVNVPVEFGLPVCVVEDQFQFILNSNVMQTTTDPEIAFEMIWKTKLMFSNIKSGSFDKGFWSKENFNQINELIPSPIMPKKGKLSVVDSQRENSEEFMEERKQHSAIESAINSLENHGLDICRDHGIDGFKRHVSLAVLAHNLHRLGTLIQMRELKNTQLERSAA